MNQLKCAVVGSTGVLDSVEPAQQLRPRRVEDGVTPGVSLIAW
ncbi:MAG: hypothetical protein ACRDO9_10445 [Gaiellales bacterium]